MLNRSRTNAHRALVIGVATVAAFAAVHVSASALTRVDQQRSGSSAEKAAGPKKVIANNLTITKDGTVLNKARVKGWIAVKADNVKIKNSSVASAGRYSIRIFPGADGTKIIGTTVDCQEPSTNGIVPGRYVARKVHVNDCRKDFGNSVKNPAKVYNSWINGRSFEIRGETTPTPTPTPTPIVNGEFPTPDSTGPRVEPTRTTGSLSSTAAGEVISGVTVNGSLVVRHDNVTVRDVRVNADSTYMIQVLEKADGTCPTNVLIEYTEIDGAAAAENDIPLYSPDCGYVFDHGYIHNVGRTSRIIDNTTISNSYIFSDRTGDSGAHRGAVGTNGGSNNQIINNVLMCEGRGCSAAIPMYGDFQPVDGLLVQHNLMATTGGYCAYGGSLDSKPYPLGSNIRFIDNHFSTRFFPTCGKYGTVTSFDNGVRGNEWAGNVWHETGRALAAPGSR